MIHPKNRTGHYPCLVMFLPFRCTGWLHSLAPHNCIFLGITGMQLWHCSANPVADDGEPWHQTVHGLGQLPISIEAARLRWARVAVRGGRPPCKARVGDSTRLRPLGGATFTNLGGKPMMSIHMLRIKNIPQLQVSQCELCDGTTKGHFFVFIKLAIMQ